MLRKILNKENFIRVGKFFYKVGILSAGVTAFTNPVSATITGVVASCSAISSAVKDKNLKALNPVINAFAVNIDRAENDSNSNWNI